MQRIRAAKLFNQFIANSRSFKTSFPIIHQIPKRPCLGSFGFSKESFSSSSDSKAKVPFLIKPMSASASSLSAVKEMIPEKVVDLLPAVEDLHGGVVVELKEPMEPEVFAASLKASMSQWRLKEKKGVWIKLPIQFANLVEPAVKEGFWYHHAESDYLMLVYWIPETAHTLPANASHRVGIGAFVMNDKREVLAVQEKSGKFRGSGVWKLPTGVVNEGEDISLAAIREVKEETGIETEFLEVLAFRQSHKSFFNKSDLFFVCVLKPHSFSIEKQASEIEEAQWIPVEEYAAQPFIKKHELFNLISEVCLAKLDSDYTGFSPYTTTTASGKTSYLYFNNRSFSHTETSERHN